MKTLNQFILENNFYGEPIIRDEDGKVHLKPNFTSYVIKRLDETFFETDSGFTSELSQAILYSTMAEANYELKKKKIRFADVPFWSKELEIKKITMILE